MIKSEKISDIIETNQVRRGTLNNVVDTLSCRAVTFKDIARLTFGINYILNQQVTSLLGKYSYVIAFQLLSYNYNYCGHLDDTKHLLEQIMRNKFDLNQPTQQTNPNFNCRKRKQIITKHTTTVSVAKRARVREPQLLDEENVDYYRHLLTESQQWNIEKENVAIEQVIVYIYINTKYDLTFLVCLDISVTNYRSGSHLLTRAHDKRNARANFYRNGAGDNVEQWLW